MLLLLMIIIVYDPPFLVCYKKNGIWIGLDFTLSSREISSERQRCAKWFKLQWFSVPSSHAHRAHVRIYIW